MTDKEMLLHLIGKLDLKETKGPYINISNNEFINNNERNVVTIRPSDGRSTFIIEYQFDDKDNLISHEVWE